MSISIFITFYFLPCSVIYSLSHSSYHSVRERFLHKKAELHRQLVLCEQMITANQNDFDVKYYSLDLVPDPVNSVLSGTVQIKVQVIAPTIDRLELNFYDGMSITGLYSGITPGSELNFSHKDDILVIELDRVYSRDELVSITVEYSGRPQDSENYGWGFGFDTYNGEPMIWSFSQPWGSRAWWPCKDVPSDKADSVDIRVTVPNNLIVASNGSLKEIHVAGNHTTYWWHEKYPIATYLVSVAIYPYEVHYDNYLYNNKLDTMKIHFYTFPGNYELYHSINMKLKEMLAFFSEKFGLYPFIDEKYGHADFTVGGAIEHQTCPSFHFWHEWVYAHELAHQWWGDMITNANWQHTWLGEGFATYSEALWYEHINGAGTAGDYQMNKNLYYGPGTIFIKDLETENPFNPNLVYKKGSWVLHMLRHVTGDTTFFEIIKAFSNDTKHRYGTATIEDFQRVCEQVSGRQLDKFFHQWIYEEYFPEYYYTWHAIQDGENHTIQLEIQQMQDNWLFWMPIDVKISTIEVDTTIVVWDSLQVQTFNLAVPAEPLQVTLDPDNWILKLFVEPFNDPSFDQGILLVNGVSFDVYGAEIRAAYEAKAFWGDFQVDFWDCFPPPAEGYPSILPDPIGHGRVSGAVLSTYSTVIWVGNNYLGDVDSWLITPIKEYLNAGGNVLLLSRMGQDFIVEDLRTYLGISWVESEHNTIMNCLACVPDLQDMNISGTQSLIAVFDTSLASNESTLLFRETSSFNVPRGLGVWRKPQTGGTFREDGGQFAFISGRPYRYQTDMLRSNVEYILDNYFGEKKETAIGFNSNTSVQYILQQNYPNPFNPVTVISWQLAVSSYVELSIYNLLGQKVATLLSEKQSAGNHSVQWDASGFSSGVYLYRIATDNGFSSTKKLLLLK